jgi:streptogramin lyase
MSETRARSVGNGIIKNSARPIKVVVGPQGEYWICDKDAEISGFDFTGAGCAAHSEVHLVK